MLTPVPTKLSLPHCRSVIGIVLAAVPLAVACGTAENSHPPAATSAVSPRGAASSSPGAAAPTSENASSTPIRFDYQPLWPFRSAEDAATWQQAYRADGHQPWHLAADQVAQTFTRDYLGYRNVDKIVKTDVREDDARVSVGFDNPNGTTATAAVVHLARFGTGADAPWEVVGTEDTTLTLTAPSYGSAITSPLTAGGRITGVDESLRVQVRRSDLPQPAGEVSGIPAGGTNSPWTATVPLTDACPGTLTIAVAAGGHTATVERFAVTGAHCG